MNSIKQQDTKNMLRNLLDYYKPIMDYQKWKLRKQSHLQLQQKITPRNKFKNVKDLTQNIIRH